MIFLLQVLEKYIYVFNKNFSLCELTRLGMIKHITFAHAHFFFEDGFINRKMVPITGRARSFLLVFKNKIERRGDRIKTTGLSIYPML